jgi:hypothetical protein
VVRNRSAPGSGRAGPYAAVGYGLVASACGVQSPAPPAPASPPSEGTCPLLL